MTTDRPVTRVGWGFDAHRLDGEPPLKLGGVIVSNTLGVTATSDGDVLTHAVTDALLGACALGDMGEHFPSSDPGLRGADSIDLLRRATAMAAEAGWRVTHIDVTVLAQSIRIAPHRGLIARNLADALGASSANVSVKASTTDGLGFVGSDEGLAAVAVVSVTSASR